MGNKVSGFGFVLALIFCFSAFSSFAEAAAFPAEPWRSYAKVIIDDTGTRNYTVSFDYGVTATQGDRTNWTGFSGQPFDVVFNWTTQGLPAFSQATAAVVQVRLPGAATIVGSSWPITIAGDNGNERRTFHFDDNPLNEVFGTNRTGMLEFYFNVTDSTGVDAWGPIDSRGAGTPPIGTTSDHARGYVRANVTLQNWTISNVSAGGLEPSHFAHSESMFTRLEIDGQAYENFNIGGQMNQSTNLIRSYNTGAGSSSAKQRDNSFTAVSFSLTAGRYNRGFQTGMVTMGHSVSSSTFDGDEKYVWRPVNQAGWTRESDLRIRFDNRWEGNTTMEGQKTGNTPPKYAFGENAFHEFLITNNKSNSIGTVTWILQNASGISMDTFSDTTSPYAGTYSSIRLQDGFGTWRINTTLTDGNNITVDMFDVDYDRGIDPLTLLCTDVVNLNQNITCSMKITFINGTAITNAIPLINFTSPTGTNTIMNMVQIVQSGVNTGNYRATLNGTLEGTWYMVANHTFSGENHFASYQINVVDFGSGTGGGLDSRQNETLFAIHNTTGLSHTNITNIKNDTTTIIGIEDTIKNNTVILINSTDIIKTNVTSIRNDTITLLQRASGILQAILDVPTNVWNFATRTLTAFGFKVDITDTSMNGTAGYVWNYTTRTVTGGGALDANQNATLYAVRNDTGLIFNNTETIISQSDSIIDTLADLTGFEREDMGVTMWIVVFLASVGSLYLGVKRDALVWHVFAVGLFSVAMWYGFTIPFEDVVSEGNYVAGGMGMLGMLTALLFTIMAAMETVNVLRKQNKPMGT